ncbi:MAG: PQQ-binding-like beta-propeller repeat protein [Acidobacteriota bacterium]|nr:PQQ-binding-like beta-propeller repeat protein [Acidobacteriota bacterium]
MGVPIARPRLCLVLLVATAAAAPAVAQNGDWPKYAGDNASTKYSRADQIHAGNVHRLEVAWRRESPDYGLGESITLKPAALFETTPVYDDGRLLMATGLGAAAALDPATGESIWFWDPYREGQSPSLRDIGFRMLRGGTSWRDGPKKRFFFTANGRLMALDAETGLPAPGFGEGGAADGHDAGDGERIPYYSWTSPPVVCNDTVVLGNSTRDIAGGAYRRALPGMLRGYDARSGELLWTFHVIPRKGEAGYETWDDGSADYTGHANVWAWMSCDEDLGMVYAPTTTPNNDTYGGHRLGDGLHAESILALDARSGELKWHFQTVHHGLWDYDFACAPILADIVVDGRPIKALAQASKQAFLYVLDRVTGEPVWPIVETPVPASRVPGEVAAATQPIPSWPKGYDLQGLGVDDLIDFTPALRAEAMAVLSEWKIGPLFDPPIPEGWGGYRGYIQVPSMVGGTNWGGAAYDPETHVVYVPSVTYLHGIRGLHPPVDPARANVDYVDARIGWENEWVDVGLEGEIPAIKPPWGRITAIALDTGEHLWVAANGDGPRDHPKLAGLDLPPLGNMGRAAPLLTKTLLFSADGERAMVGAPFKGWDWVGGHGFRAFDKRTGERVFEMQLDGGGATGAPMTYVHEGRQYIVVPLGGPGQTSELVALALAEGD